MNAWLLSVNWMMFNSAEKGRGAEAIGLYMTVNNASRLLGPVAFGLLASLTSLLVVFWTNGILMAAGGVLSDRKGRKLEGGKSLCESSLYTRRQATA